MRSKAGKPFVFRIAVANLRRSADQLSASIDWRRGASSEPRDIEIGCARSIFKNVAREICCESFSWFYRSLRSQNRGDVFKLYQQQCGPPLGQIAIVGAQRTSEFGTADQFAEIYRVSFSKPVDAGAALQIHGESSPCGRSREDCRP